MFCQYVHRGLLHQVQATCRVRWSTCRLRHQFLRQVPKLQHQERNLLLLLQCGVQGMRAHLRPLDGRALVKGNPLLMN